MFAGLRLRYAAAMCGRFAIFSPVQQLIEAFGLSAAPDELPPRYNAAPGQQLPVVLARGAERRCGLMRWGLVPFWADDPKIGNRLINARAETLATKPSFKNALRRRRCLVPADGFYEWKKTAGAKVPHYLALRSGRPMALAGLWERWEGGAEPLYTFTIVTTAPNAVVAALHRRMPAILARAHWDRWLDETPPAPEALAELLGPAPDDWLVAHPVSRAVNSPAADGPELLEPV
jgi:putative SOS response-associated peptidase YedK